jgi:hypothetical protein
MIINFEILEFLSFQPIPGYGIVTRRMSKSCSSRWLALAGLMEVFYRNASSYSTDCRFSLPSKILREISVLAPEARSQPETKEHHLHGTVSRFRIF